MGGRVSYIQVRSRLKLPGGKEKFKGKKRKKIHKRKNQKKPLPAAIRLDRNRPFLLHLLCASLTLTTLVLALLATASAHDSLSPPLPYMYPQSTTYASRAHKKGSELAQPTCRSRDHACTSEISRDTAPMAQQALLEKFPPEHHLRPGGDPVPTGESVLAWSGPSCLPSAW